MPLKIPDLITRLAQIDAPFTMRDITERLERNDLHVAVMDLPDEILKPWTLQTHYALLTNQIEFIRGNVAAVSINLVACLSLLSDVASRLQPCGSQLMAGQLLENTRVPSVQVDKHSIPMINCLAMLVTQVCEEEFLALDAATAASQPGSGAALRRTPVIFCTAWYLAWRLLQVPDLMAKGLINVQALYLVSALKENYVAYAAMTVQWLKAPPAGNTGFSPTIPMLA